MEGGGWWVLDTAERRQEQAIHARSFSDKHNMQRDTSKHRCHRSCQAERSIDSL